MDQIRLIIQWAVGQGSALEAISVLEPILAGGCLPFVLGSRAGSEPSCGRLVILSTVINLQFWG